MQWQSVGITRGRLLLMKSQALSPFFFGGEGKIAYSTYVAYVLVSCRSLLLTAKRQRLWSNCELNKHDTSRHVTSPSDVHRRLSAPPFVSPPLSCNTLSICSIYKSHLSAQFLLRIHGWRRTFSRRLCGATEAFCSPLLHRSVSLPYYGKIVLL